MGRKPKKRIDISDLRPVYTLNDKNGLKPSEELAELATKLGTAHAVEGAWEPGSNTTMAMEQRTRHTDTQKERRTRNRYRP